jgi:hypothetical protein
MSHSLRIGLINARNFCNWFYLSFDIWWTKVLKRRRFVNGKISPPAADCCRCDTHTVTQTHTLVFARQRIWGIVCISRLYISVYLLIAALSLPATKNVHSEWYIHVLGIAWGGLSSRLQLLARGKKPCRCIIHCQVPRTSTFTCTVTAVDYLWHRTVACLVLWYTQHATRSGEREKAMAAPSRRSIRYR